MTTDGKPLYTLIPLEDFKALLGVDDREDKTARFCIVTSTLSIEQYCKRRFLRKKHFETIGFYGDLVIPLREYPISNVLALYAVYSLRPSEIIEPEFYSTVPDFGDDIDLPFSLSLSPVLKRCRGINALKAVYWAGYAHNKVPFDLSSACYELATWNLNRYRGRHIGFTGNVKGKGREGQHFEMSIPENVRALLEPYRRKVI